MNFETYHLLFCLAVVFITIEVFTFAFISGSIAFGFVLSGIANYFDASVNWQITWFVIGCAIGFFSIRFIATKFFYPEDIETGSFVGRKGKVLDSDRLTVSGQTWLYTSDTPVRPGQKVKIVAIHGSVLTVKPI